MDKRDLRLSIDADLLRRAEAAGVDPARTLEAALAERLQGVRDQGRAFEGQDADGRAARWAEDNADAIADYNRRIADRGVFGQEWRRW
ncbi:MAG: type II toxin-antitoxin system CcdA family antitoxin [Caulobacter sp.]|nr:type II toxin-antitoxin system CcdA family antitoxin [Caulobacter sp.]